jgi:hypothetical protein
MNNDEELWILVYAAAIAGGQSNRSACEMADRAVIDRGIRWNGEEAGDEG